MYGLLCLCPPSFAALLDSLYQGLVWSNIRCWQIYRSSIFVYLLLDSHRSISLKTEHLEAGTYYFGSLMCGNRKTSWTIRRSLASTLPYLDSKVCRVGPTLRPRG
ncbi:hypothetical protein F4808DRAFT_447093 [Astrocystis sublimbata]|nr:hypothetical protein F4808DRAFT_447330 [Astrocystis sublimbata]KAI0187021.1 hypothetical protein F4808DRAFT_447093 [Astrocystis sublimbata]